MNGVRNIFCVGRNYKLHAAELGNAVPEQPMLFMKPTHALAPMDGGQIRLPAGSGQIDYEAEFVIRIGRSYEKGIGVDDLVDDFALGIDLTLRDVQSELKRKGRPWLAAKGFLQSAPIGAFRPFPGADSAAQAEFALLINGEQKQRGSIRDMIFSLQHIVDFCAVRYGLGAGDLIFTGTPEGVGPLSSGDRLELFWDGAPAGACTVVF